MSVSERVLWECLRKDKLGFYCPEASLCVEVDGEQHAERRGQDARRDEWLGSRGVLTIRLPSLDLFEETGLVAPRWIALVQETCERRSKRKAFPER